MTMRLALVLACGLSICFVTGSARAEEEGHEGAVEYRQRVELFMGVAHEESGDEFAAGLTYEYRVNSLIGVGGFVEHAGEEEDT